MQQALSCVWVGADVSYLDSDVSVGVLFGRVRTGEAIWSFCILALAWNSDESLDSGPQKQ